MIYVRKVQGEKDCYRIESPRYVRRQTNGVVVIIDSRTLAQGVLSPRNEIWQLAGRPSLGGAYETVEFITEEEYTLYLLEKEGNPYDPVPEPDPEDTDPVIPEDMAPQTVLTRAELTEKVMELDEALQLLLSEEVDA